MSEFAKRLGGYLRPHRTIPKLPWSADSRWDLGIGRLLILIFGLTIFGLGDSIIVNSNIGNAPWTVLAQGISLKTGITLGVATFLISSLVLLAWIPLKEKPGFGTIANILVIAAAIQFGITYLPKTNNYFTGIVFAFVGVAMVGIGSAFYITCGLGPGPRDGLMTALHHRSKIRVSRIRLAIEVVVLTLGWLLGGHVGLGTMIFALFIGQSIAVAIGVVSRVAQ